MISEYSTELLTNIRRQCDRLEQYGLNKKDHNIVTTALHIKDELVRVMNYENSSS